MNLKQDQDFVGLLNRYKPMLVKISRKYQMNRDYEESYAIALSAFFEAYKRFDETKGHFGAYAKRFCTGRLLTYMKREIKYRRDHVFPSQYGEEENVWENQCADYDHPEKELMLPELLDALKTLSPREREAIIGHFLHDLSIKELANRAGVSHSTATTWKNRGLKKLKEILQRTE